MKTKTILFFLIISFGKYFSQETFPNGQIKIKETILNGKLQGERITYFENGQVEIKANYINGLLNGEFISYFENGQLCVKRYYQNGKSTGD